MTKEKNKEVKVPTIDEGRQQSSTEKVAESNKKGNGTCIYTFIR